MADYSCMQDTPGSELFTILGPATFVVLAVVEHLQVWEQKKVIFRIDCKPAIRVLGVTIQHVRSKETVNE